MVHIFNQLEAENGGMDGDDDTQAASCNKQEMTAADVRFDRLALAQDPTLALKLLPAASIHANAIV